MYIFRCTRPLFDWNYLLVDERDAEKIFCKVFSGKQSRKNAVGFAMEVVDSLLWVERHSGTVTGLPPKERLQERIHLSLQLLFCFPAGTVNFLLLRHENRDSLPSFAVDLDEDPTDIFGAVCALLAFSALLKLQ